MSNNNRIDYLIDLIKNRIPFISEEETLLYKELLDLSLKCGNLYGQALAHIKFARLYQDLQYNEKYTMAINKAYEISEKEKYLDILTRYYNLEGIRYMQNYDEANAVTMYLKGISLAIEMSDYTLCAVLHNNIAEIFYDNNEFDQAVYYYLKALEILKPVFSDEAKSYRKIFTENIINSYCLKKDLKNAKIYLEICKNIDSDDQVRPFAMKEAIIRVLLLENKNEQALQNATILFNEVKFSKIDDVLLFYSYSFLFDVFLKFKNKENTFFCLSRLNQIKMEVSQNYEMETQKRKIQYYKAFGIENDEIFKEFYKLTLRWGSKKTKGVCNSLCSVVSLYETEKEKRLIKKERENLEELVMYDQLTGVFNRRIFDQIVEKALKDKKVTEIAYIMIDIDYFKEYNDLYGHRKGDVILKIVSTLIKEILPKQSYLSRYGGDEFACLLVNKTVKQIGQFVEEVIEKLKEKKIEHNGAKEKNYLTISLGGCHVSKFEEININAMIKKADQALYQIKENGRDGYIILKINN